MNRLRHYAIKTLIILLRLTTLFFFFLTLIWIYLAQPSFTRNTPSEAKVDRDRLRSHVKTLTVDFYPRNFRETANLDGCAAYIKEQFELAGADTAYQEFTVDGRVYRNVIGVVGADYKKKIVIGAHYDAFEDTPGADDNASGVAGLIELVYLLGEQEPERQFIFVAYTLEEPPFFMTEHMGSHQHARLLAEVKEDVVGVIVLEMIGFYSDAWGSQKYPLPLLHLMYPARGNYIAVVGRLDQRKFIRQVKNGMKGASDVPVYSISAPASLPGIDFSDHRSYWPHGIQALMITDTAFYRNPDYHEKQDTMDTLDYGRMADVVVALFEAVRKL